MSDWGEDAREGEDLEAWTTRILGERADALSELERLKESNAALRLPLMQCVAILEEFDPAEMPDRDDASAVEQAKQIVRWEEAINGGNDALGQAPSVDWRVAAADVEELAESEDGEEADD